MRKISALLWRLPSDLGAVLFASKLQGLIPPAYDRGYKIPEHTSLIPGSRESPGRASKERQPQPLPSRIPTAPRFPQNRGTRRGGSECALGQSGRRQRQTGVCKCVKSSLQTASRGGSLQVCEIISCMIVPSPISQIMSHRKAFAKV